MQLVTIIDGHVSEICNYIAINYVDTQDWRNTVFEVIRRCLEYAEGAAAETHPVAGSIDISAARNAFKQARKSVVITESGQNSKLPERHVQSLLLCENNHSRVEWSRIYTSRE